MDLDDSLTQKNIKALSSILYQVDFIKLILLTHTDSSEMTQNFFARNWSKTASSTLTCELVKLQKAVPVITSRKHRNFQCLSFVNFKFFVFKLAGLRKSLKVLKGPKTRCLQHLKVDELAIEFFLIKYSSPNDSLPNLKMKSQPVIHSQKQWNLPKKSTGKSFKV